MGMKLYLFLRSSRRNVKLKVVASLGVLIA